MTSPEQTFAPETVLRVTGSDPRADRGRREVAICSDRVTIRRRLQGIDMRLSLAVNAFEGVALCLVQTQAGELHYQVRLVHRDRDLCVILEEATDDGEIIADWRLWARGLSLPALVERTIGQYEPFLAAEPLDAAGRCARRKRPLRRRPRFLARRKVGVWPATSTVHADEREIVART